MWWWWALSSINVARAGFGSDGRIRQVEYALRASARGGLVVAVEAADGALVAAKIEDEGPVTNLRDDRDLKISEIAPNLALGTAGMAGDARHLASRGRFVAVEHWFKFGECPPARRVARGLAEHALSFSGSPLAAEEPRYRTARPMGVSALLAGVDRDGAAVYSISPGGDTRRWRAAAVGNQASAAEQALEDELRHCGTSTWTLDDAQRAVVRVMQRVAVQAAQPALSSDSLRIMLVRQPPPRTPSQTYDADTYDDGWFSPRAASCYALTKDEIDELLRLRNTAPPQPSV
ncbi:hypothetical protein CTAYLR_003682 [Chrysophaeum taylorii]|uniref:Proteasome alpha-type subunits domain-containing protein n=1 Tax=Chrysophaeum taylorii TaxID=2483200 RepID=A0AAD7XL67_9STRA|nr:hypothetical protein CTAYLR_003682 [Chrysophaeum taylorii]